MSLSVVLLAAGEGKRMKTTQPKPLVMLGDIPLVQHSLNTIKKLKPTQVLLVTGHKQDEVKKYVLENNLGDYIFCEQKERLGTGHAVKQAAPYLPDKGKTLILYSDVPLLTDKTAKKLIRSSARKKLSILTTILDNPKGYGRIIRSEKNELICIKEEIDALKNERQIKEIFSGIMVAENEFLKKGLKSLVRNNIAGEYYLTDLVEYAIKRDQRVGSHTTTADEVLGANNKSELGNLYKALVRINIKSAINKGTIFKDESTCYVEGDLTVGKDVRIGNNVTIKGSVRLGDGVVIESNALLSNVDIGANSTVKDFCSIEDSKIKSNVEVGPFARLRNGAVLDNSSKIGNFVEVKNSKIGTNAKANHHAYLGDAEIGIKTNIGAGTITCNYDGKNKNKTIIGDNVFVGSNSSLVAPLKIGKKSYIAAGSVITQDVPNNSLAFGRSRQSTKNNWKKK
ncbi:MAG: bifunctional UDP-N-acetylglucosamine diphosphorylase/glucosamine-1-phosphate N-acetyltransferase GlmU [SAR86 cluster bacterium]|nr:bifunctional UDP-N-acetylglucosamine diphosphorylase/glucosamine-1-phosphate N-acetyltransferase GlmU [SAR86 cluster bacterium]MDA0899660.1 bifunctional UDP-N-acetylglucosamine diphosphorylase/glucosamine-1-phosphate N-acetyltransferase GlmU [Pseudomonadota bacterium]